ncbi:energy-coupling factor transporter ATPase [Bacillaceae bacterium W0354]
MIQFKNITFKYDSHSEKVLDKISFTIKRGEWVSLVGHNGSGKSTIAKLMNGLLLPTEGEIIINDMTLNDQTIWDVRREVGMVFQNPENQFVGTTVIDDVAFGLENIGVEREEMKKRIDQSLAAVGMLDYKMHEPHRLSGGQKQRVAIASILAIMPNVIIFDEASTMLDPTGRLELIETIKSLRRKNELTIISITHDLNEAVQSDRIIALNKGEIWFDGKPEQLLEKSDELPSIDLLPPLVTQIVQALKHNGIEFVKEPLQLKELVDQLWTLHLKK